VSKCNPCPVIVGTRVDRVGDPAKLTGDPGDLTQRAEADGPKLSLAPAAMPRCRRQVRASD
jgi:hypothetical protein